jgi:hypothetical protein
MTNQPNEFTARVVFDPALRARWPTTEVIVEARLLGEPWSIKLRLWSPPDETGTCMASAVFLIPDAPHVVGIPITLTLGRTVVGRCTLISKPERNPALSMELDFLEVSTPHPVRTAA